MIAAPGNGPCLDQAQEEVGEGDENLLPLKNSSSLSSQRGYHPGGTTQAVRTPIRPIRPSRLLKNHFEPAR